MLVTLAGKTPQKQEATERAMVIKAETSRDYRLEDSCDIIHTLSTR